ncbi:MAG: hypothetical protein AB7Q01_12870 [Gammaproteobacteria bacterium]
MKRIPAVLAVAMSLAATSVLACDGSGKSRTGGSQPAGERQA